MKKLFLKRAIISGVLWAILMILLNFVEASESVAVYIFVVGVILAVVLGKAILETVTNATGLNFFMSWYGVFIFYLGVAVFSVLIAPIYCLWNLFKFVSTPSEA